MGQAAKPLPPEIAARLNPQMLRNEAAYWASRDQLLPQYEGLWVGFADGKVIASGRSAVAVLHEAQATGLHPYVACVGKERTATRIRRTTFAYDSTYPSEPLPVARVEYRATSGVTGVVVEQVIPDTGSDSSVLPWTECERIGLATEDGIKTTLTGVAGGEAESMEFGVWVFLDGQEYPCRLQVDFHFDDRLLGRDVLNHMDVLFRGTKQRVVFNP